MEPLVLLLGKNLSTLGILKNELVKFDRNIIVANSEEMIASILKNEKIDLVIVGAGLPEETITSMVNFSKNINADIETHIMEKTPGMTPVSMIAYTSEKAIMWKMKNAIQ